MFYFFFFFFFSMFHFFHFGGPPLGPPGPPLPKTLLFLSFSCWVREKRNKEKNRTCGCQQHRHHKTSGHRRDHVRNVHADRMHVRKSWRSGNLHHPAWVEGHTGGSPVNTHSTPVPPYRGEAVGSSPTETTEDRDSTTDEPETLHKTYESRMVAEPSIARPWQTRHGAHDGTEQGSLTADDITNVLKIELDCRPGAISCRVSGSRSTKRRLDTHCQTTRRVDRHSRAADPDADSGKNSEEDSI